MSEPQAIRDRGASTDEQRPLEVSSTPGRVIRSVLIFAVVGIVLYAAAVFASDYNNILSSLFTFPVGLLVVVLGMVLLGWLLRGWRFHYYLRKSFEPVPLGYSITAFLAGFALTGTPGKVGEAVKGVFLKRDYGVSYTKVVGILVVERLMDLLGVLLLASFSLMLFSAWQRLFFLCTAIVLAGGLFLCMEKIYRPVLETVGRISHLRWISQKILVTLLAGRDLMTPMIFLVGLVVSIFSWGLESLSFFLILRGFDLSSTVLQANFVYCFSTIVGALSMLPGGIGGTEAGMVGLLTFMGVPYANTVAPVILIRLCTLWMAVLVGVVFMIVLLAKSRQKTKTVKRTAA